MIELVLRVGARQFQHLPKIAEKEKALSEAK